MAGGLEQDKPEVPSDPNHSVILLMIINVSQNKFPLVHLGLLLVFKGIEHDLIAAATTICFNDSFKDLVGGNKKVDFFNYWP